MSALSIPASDFRALEQFNAVPAGHTGIIVTSNSFAPHLRPGEIAVVNPNDKEPVSGELFVIAFDRLGERVTHIVQTFGRMAAVIEDGKGVDRLCWWDRFEFKRPGEMILSDGPRLSEGWRDRRCVGRVIGFVAPAWEHR